MPAFFCVNRSLIYSVFCRFSSSCAELADAVGWHVPRSQALRLFLFVLPELEGTRPLRYRLHPLRIGAGFHGLEELTDSARLPHAPVHVGRLHRPLAWTEVGALPRAAGLAGLLAAGWKRRLWVSKASRQLTLPERQRCCTQ